MDYDSIIIGTLSGYKEILRRLLELGIPKSKIDVSYVEQPTKAREVFLRDMSILLNEKQILGSVAEGGVFQGEFAAIINQYFPNRNLYLFDTFTGFDKRDVEKEGKFSFAQEGDYSITTETEVLNKMRFPEKCILKKGYFPLSAEGIREKFCFVNLDFDLYNPTIKGLEWFGARMEAGGRILVHDYFNNQFKGIKQAVSEYCSDRKHISLSPIGDGISILLSGF